MNVDFDDGFLSWACSPVRPCVYSALLPSVTLWNCPSEEPASRSEETKLPKSASPK